MQLSTLQLALLSSTFTFVGVLLAALVAGLYNLRAKRNEYVNDYYKEVIQRRIAAYEELEKLVVPFKMAVLDKDNKPYHLPFAGEGAKNNIFGRFLSAMSHGLWISDEAFASASKLNHLLFSMPETESDAIGFGKQHYKTITEIRHALERIMAADMLELHKVEQFLKRKKSRQDPGLQPVRLNG
jgi:hypothetical protein